MSDGEDEVVTEPGDPEPLEAAPPHSVRRAQEERLLKAWKTSTGLRYWSAVNNTVVGLWYTVAAGLFFLFGGVLALVMRLQLAVRTTTSWTPNSTARSSPYTVRS